VLDIGGCGQVGVGGRVDQELCRQRRAAAVACAYGADRREVAAGAVATDHERAGLVLGGPQQRREAVIERHREGMLGSEPVADAEDARL
jgi:hypothetical protein